MANLCDTMYRFFVSEVDKEHKKQLKKFYSKISKVYDDNRNTWLGDVAKCFGINPESISCKGDIYFISEMDEENDYYFEIATTTAYEPLNEIWDILLSQEEYEGIEYVYRAEEPSCEIYINTDYIGEIFPERYKLEIWLDEYLPAELPKTHFQTDDIDNLVDEDMYFQTFEELINFLRKFMIIPDFTEVHEVQEHIDEAFLVAYAGNRDWGWVCIREFDY